jgi:hypothetical protein
MGYGNTETFSTRNIPSSDLPNGLYLLKGETKEQDAPGVMIPVAKLGDKFYSMKIDRELTLDGFTPGSRLLGPMQ